MSTHGDDSTVHHIRDGRFVCTAPAGAPCRVYPACACEHWSEELHGDTPEPGHEPISQEECWATPWLDAVELWMNYQPADGLMGYTFPDGPVTISWEDDYLGWAYADDTQPTPTEEDA